MTDNTVFPPINPLGTYFFWIFARGFSRGEDLLEGGLKAFMVYGNIH